MAGWGAGGASAPSSVGVSENFGNLISVRRRAEFRHLRPEGQE